VVVDGIRGESDDLPLFLMANHEDIDAIPMFVVHQCDGFIYSLDDTADWIAGRLRDAAQCYRRHWHR
jgi:hypothetical protein